MKKYFIFFVVIILMSCSTTEVKKLLLFEGFFPVRKIDVNEIDFLSDRIEILGRVNGSYLINEKNMNYDESATSVKFTLSEYTELSKFFENSYSISNDSDYITMAIAGAFQDLTRVAFKMDCDFLCFPQYSLETDVDNNTISAKVSALACRIKRTKS